MNTEIIAKGMIDLQDTFLRHSFYVSDFMQEQTKRTLDFMNKYRWIDKNGLKAVNDSIEYARATNKKIQKMWDLNIQGMRRMIG